MGDFPDPVDGDSNGTFYVISHTDSNGNTCSIDYPSTAAKAGRSSGTVVVEPTEKPLEISQNSV